MHGVRNGIAHGKVVFTDGDINYIDKKGNKGQLLPKEVVAAFDGTLDVTNGFGLALKVFYFTSPDFLDLHEISIPQSILLEELQAVANAPAWDIIDCLESVAAQDKRQLIVYVKNKNWDFGKVRLYCFVTAYWAEKLTQTYDRVFISLHSSHSKHGPTGWAAFNGTKLKKLREREETRLEAYGDILEDDLIYFNPKMKFPGFIYKLGTFRSILANTLPLAWRRYINEHFKRPFIIRETQIHSKKYFTVVKDSSIVIKPEFLNNASQLIKSAR